MGGQTSKTFKLRGKHQKRNEEGEKRTSVTGVQYRDKEFQLARETKSAYYYDHKNDATGGADNSDTTAVQKRVILQRAGSSDHTLFKRVRETPTAIYYEPNETNDVDTVDDSEKLEKKNIILENAPAVEEQIKVIRDGSSDIVIRPHTIDKDQSEDVKGLTTIVESKDHKGELLSESKDEEGLAAAHNEQPGEQHCRTEEQNEQPVAQRGKLDLQLNQQDEQRNQPNKQLEQPAEQHEQPDDQHEQLAGTSEQKEEPFINKEDKETKIDEHTVTESEIKETVSNVGVSEMSVIDASQIVDIESNEKGIAATSDEKSDASTKDKTTEVGEDTKESEAKEDNGEDGELPEETKNKIEKTESIKPEKEPDYHTNGPPNLENPPPVISDTIESKSPCGQQSHEELYIHEGKHIKDSESKEENSIPDKESDITIINVTQSDKEAEQVDT